MNELQLANAGAWPWLVALAALAVLAAVGARRAERWRRELVGPRLDAVAGAPRWRRTRAALDAAALLAIGAALLQPVAPGAEGDGGADVVLCVDVSWSMAARDQQPTRLGAVQEAIAALPGLAGGSRTALVAFAGDAAVHAPLTTDAGAVVALANELFPGAHGAGGTDPGAAIDVAAELLRRSGRGGAIVLLGDGEDFAGGGPAAAARARTLGFVVHTLGCGDEAGSKIVVEGDAGETFLRDEAGGDVVTRRETAALQALAAAGGGRSERLHAGALRALHDDVILPAARAAAVRAGRLAPVQRFHWPLLAAIALWMLRQCLPERDRR